MKHTLAITLAAVFTLSGCTQLAVTWPKHPPANDGVYSRKVALVPYTAQGVDVAGSDNWYYGKTKGISGYTVQGGIVYVTKDEIAQMQQKNANNKAKALLHEGCSAGDKTGLLKPDKDDTHHATENPSSSAQSTLAAHTTGTDGANKDRVGLDANTLLPPQFLAAHPMLHNSRLMTSVHFPLNKSHTLYDASKKRLGEWLKQLDGDQKAGFVIVGYTDDIGRDDYNIPLAKKRAAFVAEKIKHVMPEANITLIASGSRPTIADNRQAGGRKINRRVEVYRLKAKSAASQSGQSSDNNQTETNDE